MRIKKKTLKSWDKKEISHLKKTLKKTNKSRNTDFEHASYWLVTFLGVLSGIVAACVFATAGIIIPAFWLSIMAALTGLGIGNTFSAAISELDHLKKEHHIIFSGIIIISTILSFVFVAKMNFFYELSRALGIEQSPYIVGGAYLVFFLFPYYIKILREKHERMDN